MSAKTENEILNIDNKKFSNLKDAINEGLQLSMERIVLKKNVKMSIEIKFDCSVDEDTGEILYQTAIPEIKVSTKDEQIIKTELPSSKIVEKTGANNKKIYFTKPDLQISLLEIQEEST